MSWHFSHSARPDWHTLHPASVPKLKNLYFETEFWMYTELDPLWPTEEKNYFIERNIGVVDDWATKGRREISLLRNAQGWKRYRPWAALPGKKITIPKERYSIKDLVPSGIASQWILNQRSRKCCGGRTILKLTGIMFRVLINCVNKYQDQFLAHSQIKQGNRMSLVPAAARTHLCWESHREIEMRVWRSTQEFSSFLPFLNMVIKNVQWQIFLYRFCFFSNYYSFKK